MKLYVIRDVLAGYGVGPGMPAIIDAPNDQCMKRIVKGSVAKGQKPNYLNTNPEDKEVWCVGELNQETGQVTACQPYLVAKAIDFLDCEVLDDGTN